MNKYLRIAIHLLLSLAISLIVAIVLKVSNTYFEFGISEFTQGLVVGMVYIECLYGFKKWKTPKKDN